MNTFLKALLLGAVLGGAGLVSAGGVLPVRAEGADAAAEAAERTMTFEVANMTCASCPIAVRSAMRRVEGVKAVEVDYATRTARVIFDPHQATPEAIAEASTEAGFPAAPQG